MAHTLTVHPVPEKGEFKLSVPAVVDVKISAEEAQKECRIWLMEKINTAFVTDPPQFILAEDGRAVWRVPVMRSAMHVGFSRINQ